MTTASTVRLTAAEALVRFLAAQRVETPTGLAPLFGGVFAVFGHGNVAGLGEALYRHREVLPTYRAHNEQGMAHTAIAYAKAHFRRRMMAVTSSIGPGATNMVTAAATAHVNRLPLLLLPGDVFASRAPDPVLQQVEDFGDGTLTASDCFRPVSRYFDRIMRPEQLAKALPQALRVLTNPALCGPVTLSFPQDVQTMAWDYPAELFEPRTVRFRAPPPDEAELREAARALAAARRPLVIAGGGVLYSEGACAALRAFAERHGVPVAETMGGKSALPWDHALQAGTIGHTGGPAANELAREADLVLAVGTRLNDFTTGSHSLFPQARLLGLNVNGFDAVKWHGLPLVADARRGLDALSAAAAGWRADEGWTAKARGLGAAWRDAVQTITSRRDAPLPYDGEVIGAVQRTAPDSPTTDLVLTAGGTIPNELEKLWRAAVPGGFHVEYGYSCMGYEIAGGIGAKMAHPDREVIVILGDGSYLMLNSELATSVLLDRKLIVIVLDNHGFGCINRLQKHTGGEAFNNLFQDCVQGSQGAPAIDFAAHARALGALGENVKTIPELEAALARARKAERSTLLCIETDPTRTTQDGGCWWEVAIPETSPSEKVQRARAAYEQAKRSQRNLTMALDVRIGINPISWMNDDLPELGGDTPLERALSEGAQIGYAGFELGNKFPKEPAALRATLAPYGLACVSGWYSGRLAARSVEEELREVEGHLRLLLENGARVMVYGEVQDSVQGQIDTPLGRRPHFRDDDAWKRYGERVTLFARALLARGMRLAYHHHMGAYVQSPEDLDRLMALTGEEAGLLFDTGHATFGGGDAVALLGKHLARVCHVHCKDVRAPVMELARARGWSFLESVLNGVFTVPGDGCVDFRGVLALLERRGYAGWLVVEAEQDPAVAPSYQYAEMGYRHLAGLVRELQAGRRP